MQMIIHVKTFELPVQSDNKHLTTVMRVLQVISGCIAACWLLLIAFAQFNCSIFPGFGHQCSRGEGDIWLLPFIYSPVGGVGLIVWLVIIGIRRYSPQTQPTSGTVTALVIDAPLIPVNPHCRFRVPKNETHTSNTQNHWQPTRAAIIGGIVAFVVLVWSLRADLENSRSDCSLFCCHSSYRHFLFIRLSSRHLFGLRRNQMLPQEPFSLQL